MSFVTDMFSSPETPDYSGAIKAAEFKPYSISSGFGTSKFNTADQTAGYTLDPRLAAFRDMFYTGATNAAPTADQLKFGTDVSNYGMGLFGKAANLDTNQIASDYLNKQLALLAPGRAQQDVQTADTLFKTGRTGAGVGMTNVAGQTGYVNPEQFSLLSAREGQNAQLGLESTDRARQMQIDDINKALGYYGVGQQFKTSPYETMAQILGYGTGVEKLGLTPLTLGADIGGTAAGAGANVGRLLASQEDARVAAENTPGLFETLLGTAASYALPGIGGAIGKGVGGWMGNIFGNTAAAGTSNVSPGIRLY